MSVHIQVPVGDLQGNMAGSGKPSASASSFDWTSAWVCNRLIIKWLIYFDILYLITKIIWKSHGIVTNNIFLTKILFFYCIFEYLAANYTQNNRALLYAIFFTHIFNISLNSLKNATTSISPSALWILVRTEMRPWSEFVRPANFTKPTDGSSLVALQRVITDRLLINGLHFRYNYALVSCVLMLYSL